MVDQFLVPKDIDCIMEPSRVGPSVLCMDATRSLHDPILEAESLRPQVVCLIQELMEDETLEIEIDGPKIAQTVPIDQLTRVRVRRAIQDQQLNKLADIMDRYDVDIEIAHEAGGLQNNVVMPDFYCNALIMTPSGELRLLSYLINRRPIQSWEADTIEQIQEDIRKKRAVLVPVPADAGICWTAERADPTAHTAVGDFLHDQSQVVPKRQLFIDKAVEASVKRAYICGRNRDLFEELWHLNTTKFDSAPKPWVDGRVRLDMYIRRYGQIGSPSCILTQRVVKMQNKGWQLVYTEMRGYLMR